MDRILRYAAVAACIVQIITVGIILSHTYRGRDFFLALLLVVPPALSIAALWTGPDREERRLRRQVEKLRLRVELKELEGKAGQN